MYRKPPAGELARLGRLARARGGLLLSRSFLGNTVKLRFRCAEGHEWAHSPTKLEQGKWCPECARAGKHQVAKTRAYARLQRAVAGRGGTIVSPAYGGSNEPLQFRCAEGHGWSTSPKSILGGGWCPGCARSGGAEGVERRRQEAIRRLLRVVRKRGGEMLSPVVIDWRTKVRIRCGRGHVWCALPQRVQADRWCLGCRQDALLAAMRELARTRGGECLSRTCRSGAARLEWRCAKGHRFRAVAAWVRQGTWCSRCRWYPPDDIEHMRQIARERGGLCLSAKYVDKVTKLRWRCGKGHVWKSQPGSVQQGSWCPVCRLLGRRRARLSIEELRATAAERGGACLSSKYQGCNVHLRWRCARGHTWGARPWQVRQGHWCPACAHRVPGTLAAMRALAEQRGGRCRTRTWNDHRQPLVFECERGHRFGLLSVVAKTGVWCPLCKRRAGSRGRAATSRTPPSGFPRLPAPDAI